MFEILSPMNHHVCKGLQTILIHSNVAEVLLFKDWLPLPTNSRIASSYIWLLGVIFVILHNNVENHEVDFNGKIGPPRKRSLGFLEGYVYQYVFV